MDLEAASASTAVGDWLHSFCVVNFDLEVGQSLENLFRMLKQFQYPPDTDLSDADKTNICYMAFPDSNSGCMGDSTFHFRICPQYDVFGALISNNNNDLSPCQNTSSTSPYDLLRNIQAKYELTPAQLSFNRAGPPALRLADNVLFGFVFFRQCRDSTIRRGYMQKSLVILTRWPLPQLWVAVLNLVAPEFFKRNNDRNTILECIARDIGRWPSPHVGIELHLPVMGHVIRTQLPGKMFSFDYSADRTFAFNDERHSYRARRSLTGVTSITSPIIDVPNSFAIDLYEALHGVISHVHVLWELVLLQEPLIIIGTSPTQCSLACQALVQSIWPLHYAADYRPFYTIHDPNFRSLSSNASPSHRQTTDSAAASTAVVPRIMLAVTNPFFAKALDHWPHIVRLTEDESHVPAGVPLNAAQQQHKNSPKKSPNGSVFLQAVNNNSSNNSHAKFKQRSTRQKLFDSKPGLYSEYVPFLHKHDKILLKQLATTTTLGQKPTFVAGGSATLDVSRHNAAVLRRHLLDLTQSFMLPLERYVSSSLMPLQRNVNPFRNAPQLKPFVEEEFLGTLEQSGPQLTTGVRGDWNGTFWSLQTFLSHQHIFQWLLQISTEINEKLEVMHLEALVSSDLSAWAQDKCEVEQIDMALRLRRLLNSAADEDESPLGGSGGGVQQFVVTRRAELQKRLEVLLSCIPIDARQLVMPQSKS